MNGRRIPIDEIQNAAGLEQPGDYCGPIMGFTGDKPAVFFLKPHARDEGAPIRGRSVQHVTSPPHVFKEMLDGSLEIRESIGDTAPGAPESDGLHGYLDAGHTWRQV
jgi:hypothetical protein